MCRSRNNSQWGQTQSVEEDLFKNIHHADAVVDQVLPNIKEKGRKKWDVKSVKNYINSVYVRAQHTNKYVDNTEFDVKYFNTNLTNKDNDYLNIVSFNTDDKRLFIVSLNELPGKIKELERYLKKLNALRPQRSEIASNNGSENSSGEDSLDDSNQVTSPENSGEDSSDDSNQVTSPENSNEVEITEFTRLKIENALKIGDYSVVFDMSENDYDLYGELLDKLENAINKDLNVFRHLHSNQKEDLPMVDFDDVKDSQDSKVPIIEEDRETDIIARNSRKQDFRWLIGCLNEYYRGRCFKSFKDVKERYKKCRESENCNRNRNRNQERDQNGTIVREIDSFSGKDHIVIDGIENLPVSLRFIIADSSLRGRLVCNYFDDVLTLQQSLLTDQKKYDYIYGIIEECIYKSVRRASSGGIKIAPMYYRKENKIQYLLPLFFREGTSIADCTLIMDLDEDGKFHAKTILNMFESYVDVRLVDDPDKYPWLDY